MGRAWHWTAGRPRDSAIQEIRQDQEDPNRIHYVLQNGFLFWSLPEKAGGHRDQLMIPSSLRPAIFKYGHDNPLSGHLGRLKTLMRILNMAYWPTIRKDVWDYCKQCQDKHRMWDRWLPEFRSAINSAWHENTGFTLGELALGRKLKGLLENLIKHAPDPEQSAYDKIQHLQQMQNMVKENVQRRQLRQARYYNARRKEEEFKEGEGGKEKVESTLPPTDKPLLLWRSSCCSTFLVLYLRSFHSLFIQRAFVMPIYEQLAARDMSEPVKIKYVGNVKDILLWE
ncbi:hypothetical protein AOLI_G00184180 [Acnodon oligacanthus]